MTTPISENKQRMLRGELYHAFTPELVDERARCTKAVNRFNDTRETSRRHRVELWRYIGQDTRPMPPKLDEEEADSKQFDETDPWIEPPLHADYGYNLYIAPHTFLNFNTTLIDTCPITIGARTLIGPNCSFYTGTHPLDPAVRRGTEGPEGGKPVVIEEDCWIGGGVTVLPGVRIGKGAVVGAASVVTRDVPEFHVVAGSPARVIKKISTEMDPSKREGNAEG